jgi:hypothetical protein
MQMKPEEIGILVLCVFVVFGIVFGCCQAKHVKNRVTDIPREK